jgi:hypothetical protein
MMPDTRVDMTFGHEFIGAIDQFSRLKTASR